MKNPIIELENLLKKLKYYNLLTDNEEEQIPEMMLQIERGLKPGKSPYFNYIKELNKITGKSYKGDTQSRELFYQHYELFTMQARLRAVKNAMKFPQVVNSPEGLTPKKMCIPINIAYYANL